MSLTHDNLLQIQSILFNTMKIAVDSSLVTGWLKDNGYTFRIGIQILPIEFELDGKKVKEDKGE